MAPGSGRSVAERQEKVLASEIDKLRQQKNPPAELVRLAGSLERLGPEIKAELVDRFITAAVELMRARSHVAPHLAALGLLLNRTPLYAGPETVVSPELVERAWHAFEGFDWADPELAEMQTLFLRAARVVDDRTVDVPRGLRERIANKLENSGRRRAADGPVARFRAAGARRAPRPLRRGASTRPDPARGSGPTGGRRPMTRRLA